MNIPGAALNQQSQQAPNIAHQQVANMAYQQGFHMVHQTASQLGNTQSFIAPQNLQNIPQVLFAMQAMQVPINALNVAAQQGINQQGINQQGINQQSINQHSVNQQVVNQQAINQQGVIPGVLAQKAIPTRILNNQRTSNTQGTMFRPFQMPLINTAQALHLRHQQFDNASSQVVASEALQQRAGGNTQNSNGDIVKRDRALNMWIAFRSYYTKIFPGIQQKEASSHLTVLWRKEPFKAKWAILAEAYTLIRDALGKEQSPLDKFLQTVCPAIGIIPQDEYLQKLNWTREIGNEGRLILTQTAPPSQFILETYGTEINVMGVVQVAIDMENKEPFDIKKMAQLMKLNFSAAIVREPKLMAAKILGLSKGHPFLEVMSQRMHDWTGNLSQLYDPNEHTMDLQGMAGDEHNTTDISYPPSFNSFQNRSGQAAPAAQFPDDTDLIYNFAGSF